MLQKKSLTKKIIKPSSSLNVKVSDGKADIYHTSWVVMGPPGIGKSTLFSGFEDCLFLCISEKEVRRLRVPYVHITTWEQMLETTDELINNREKYPYKFIVIDFIDAVWTMCAIATCEKLGVSHYTDAQYGKGSDTLDNYFKKWVTQLIASDYGVMFVSHVNQKDVLGAGGVTTKTVCTLPNRARNLLFPLINVIGCMEYRTIKQVVQDGKIAFVKKRIIMFEGTDYVEAKDRDGVLPKEIVLMNDSNKNFEIFKEYYDGKRKR
jgi:hypothetical protein